jgi:hypothetical protein
MLGTASLECQPQPVRIKPRKSSPIQLAGFDLRRGFFPNSLASSVKVDALSCAAFIKPSRPRVRASILAVKWAQGGKRPWR